MSYIFSHVFDNLSFDSLHIIYGMKYKLWNMDQGVQIKSQAHHNQYQKW